MTPQEHQIVSLESSTAGEKHAEEVLKLLQSSPSGLSEKEAEKRLLELGKNTIKEEKKESKAVVFLKKFLEPLILLLIASAVISIFLNELIDAFAILFAVFLVVLLSFAQEYRSEKALEAIKKLASPKCRVLRENMVREISAEEVAIGDVVILEAGDKVAADLKLIEDAFLKIDESLLTGESRPEAKKNSEKGKKSLAYAGTTVVEGKGKGIVFAAGKNTELGKIAAAIEKIAEDKTPLQKRLDTLGKQLSAMAVVISIGIFFFGIVQQLNPLDVFKIAVSLAVAAIPEGLPVAVTITLALGIQRMAKENAIVKKLISVETLGTTTVICSDKTGTITTNELEVAEIYPSTDEAVQAVFLSSLHSSDAVETALLRYGEKNLTENAGREIKNLKKLREIPFNYSKRYSGVEYSSDNGNVFFMKGVLEKILGACALRESEEKEIENKAKEFSSQALRVIALAIAKHQRDVNASAQQAGALAKAQTEELGEAEFVCLVAMRDAIKEGVKEAIKECRKAGIKVVMITGDSKETALAIAKELELNENSLALSGDELMAMSDRELDEKIMLTSIFYRTMPLQKMKIVHALKDLNQVTAMTGDGINDAPALKAADIGVVMGKTGSEVAKEAGDMILGDDNFSTIVKAVEEGRAIYNNIKNFIRFELTTSIAAVSVVALGAFLSPFLGIPSAYSLPLNALQILWINIIMDGPPAQSLGVEKPHRGIMEEKPRSPTEEILTRELLALVMLASFFMLVGTLFIFFSELKTTGDFKKARTLAFTTFVMFQMFNAFNSRSERYSFFELGIFSNRYLIIGVLGSLAMQTAILYTPFFQNLFGVVALGIKDWAMIILLTLPIIIVEETRKWSLRKMIY